VTATRRATCWPPAFGTGVPNGSPDVLYFTDGINREMDRLFGAIAVVMEPTTWALMLLGFGRNPFVALIVHS
jgi:hypothetical protein